MKTAFKSFIGLFFISFCSFLTAQNPTTINGSIAVSDEILAALTVQHGQNLLTTGMGFEVWSVVYRDVKSKEGVVTTRVYLNQKQTNALITPSLGQAGGSKSINIKVTGIPQEGDFILLYYFNAYPAQFKYFKVGSKLDDGTNRTGLPYATNAPLKIGKNKKYGAISILSIGKNQIYTTSINANTTGIAAFGWGDIIDFFEDLVDAVWKGGKTLAGVVVDATGTLLVQAYGISQALIADGYLPDYREVTASEYTWVNTKIFNGNLPARSKIVITNLYGYGHRQFVFPTGAGIILMNLGEKGFGNPLSKIRYQTDANEKPGEVFIHEMTHVWQIHTAADINFIVKAISTQAGGASAYTYNAQTCDGGKKWKDFNVEQQAEIVRHCFNKRESNNTTSCQQKLVEDNIRKGVDFPIQRTPECQTLINQLAANAAAIKERTEHFSKRVLLMKASESPTGKPVWGMEVDKAALEADPTYKNLKRQREELLQKQSAINCK